jgi:hypothetical protein
VRPQDRGEFGISELLDACAIVRAAVLDRLHGFTLQAVANLLKRPAFARDYARRQPRLVT